MAQNIEIKINQNGIYNTLYPTTLGSNVSYSNSSTSSLITHTNVQGAIDDLFTSVSNGKSLIASAITDKGVSTSSNASFSTMSENIGKISSGGDGLIVSNDTYEINAFTPTITSDKYGVSATIPTGKDLNRVAFIFIYQNDFNLEALLRNLSTTKSFLLFAHIPFPFVINYKSYNKSMACYCKMGNITGFSSSEHEISQTSYNTEELYDNPPTVSNRTVTFKITLPYYNTSFSGYYGYIK